jgi:amidohydrolase
MLPRLYGDAIMPLLNRAVEMQDEIASWRRRIHQQPELLFDLPVTSSFVAASLKAFGCDEVVTGIGRCGVVGVINGRHGHGPVLAMRADMDALPITEETGVSYTSQTHGQMHACGHDGHVAMLLGAARYLCETRNFHGQAVVVFQPAEEGGGGGKEMVADGLMDQFNIESVYAMHSWPGLPIGHFATTPGAIQAAMDVFSIEIAGKGGHAATPHLTVDPIYIGIQITSALLGITSRNTDPFETAVLSVTKFQAGHTHNVIPPTASILGTIRTLNQESRNLMLANLRRTAEGIATALGGTATVSDGGIMPYPVTYNHPTQAAIAARIARQVSGEHNVDDNFTADMGAEDFSFMLQARPGAMILLGNGNSAYLHHPQYDFDDDSIPYGVSFWVQLVESELAPNNAGTSI